MLIKRSNFDEEAFNSLLEKLNHKAQDATIIVEGKKDQASLRLLGINARFFLLSKKSIYESAESVSKLSKRALLLLDSDKKGIQLSKKMKTHLQDLGVKVDDQIGNRLLRLAKVQTVESLKRFC